MKLYDWNDSKNAKLKAERFVSFEDVLTTIDTGNVLDNIEHPNNLPYGSQKILVDAINNYVFLVPYTEDDEKIFLKTIYPSRKFTKKYLKDK